MYKFFNYYYKNVYIFTASLPVCNLTWTFKLPLVANSEPHTWQTKFFSPVWILMWLSRVDFTAKAFLHISQTYGLSPVWILMWRTRSLGFLKLLGQWVQPWLYLGKYSALSWKMKWNNWETEIMLSTGWLQNYVQIFRK